MHPFLTFMVHPMPAHMVAGAGGDARDSLKVFRCFSGACSSLGDTRFMIVGHGLGEQKRMGRRRSVEDFRE